MVRSNQNQSNNGRSQPKANNEDCELMTPDTPTSPERDSVHKQNLYIVSFPIIFLFNILRAVLYQFFIVFKYMFNVTAQFRHRPAQRNENNIEIAVDDDALKDKSVAQVDEMAAPVRSSGPGPGDPLLAKQKHHHRRAFEYISRALKIDEENEGKKQWFSQS